MLYFILFLILFLTYLIFFANKISLKVVRIKTLFFPTLIVIFIISLVTFSNSCYQSASEGFMLWVSNVIPSLLPFFICIELLKHTTFMQTIGKILEPIIKPLFNVPGCGAFALAMGISSGYPTGAKIVSNLRKEKLCSKVEGERLLAFTNTSGPLFIIGAVGIAMFNDSKIGFLLLLTHFLSAITVGIIFRNYKKATTTKDIISQNNIKSNNKITFKNLGNIMGESIKNSINTLLLIGGYIVFFSVLGTILQETGIINYFSHLINKFLKIFDFNTSMSKGIIEGILEVTGRNKNIIKFRKYNV